MSRSGYVSVATTIIGPVCGSGLTNAIYEDTTAVNPEGRLSLRRAHPQERHDPPHRQGRRAQRHRKPQGLPALQPKPFRRLGNGHPRQSLLNAGTLDHAGPANVRNLSIRGEGTISGGGKKLYDATMALYPKKVDGLRARGRLLLLMNAENVEAYGLTIEESPCWTLHYIYSKNVSIHGLTIRSNVHNGDGIDPDSHKNSLIFDCTFDTGDDCIAIKSGKNPEGNIINRPTENVRIFDCRFINGHGISIGSEMSGGVRNVAEHCIAGPLLHGLQIKATPKRGGFVENVTVRDCSLRQITVYTQLAYNNDSEAAPAQPFFKNFRFENIDLTQADAAKPVIIVNGFPAEGRETRDVTFSSIKLPAGAKVQIDRCAPT